MGASYIHTHTLGLFVALFFLNEITPQFSQHFFMDE